MRGVAAAVAVLVSTGCGSHAIGETRHETTSVELDGAETTGVEIRMGAGELYLAGGTPKLLEADFTYNVPEWKPVVSYHAASAVRGDLIISQPDSGGASGHTTYIWKLKLNGQRPLDLTANLGAGEATMDLGQMNIRNAVVNIGAGELRMDLRGQPAHDYTVMIHGGVGEATVNLPKDVGISATASGGIGGISASGLEQRNGVWINPDAPNASPIIHLDVKGGVGQINLVR